MANIITRLERERKRPKPDVQRTKPVSNKLWHRNCYFHHESNVMLRIRGSGRTLAIGIRGKEAPY